MKTPAPWHGANAAHGKPDMARPKRHVSRGVAGFSEHLPLLIDVYPRNTTTFPAPGGGEDISAKCPRSTSQGTASGPAVFTGHFASSHIDSLDSKRVEAID